MTRSTHDGGNRKQLLPRKSPSQSRAARTIDAILQAAADVLERTGLEGYNTNDIATRAGASIGSLYQYFPSKDAITVALIERETALLVEEVLGALDQPDISLALRATIEIAVRHQLHRPRLARLLDFEQNRFSAIMPTSNNAAMVRSALTAFLCRSYGLQPDVAVNAAGDVISIIRSLTDAAGEREQADPAKLRIQIVGAVSGYLSTFG